MARVIANAHLSCYRITLRATHVAAIYSNTQVHERFMLQFDVLSPFTLRLRGTMHALR
jgi:hypothetical protein